MGAIEAPRRLLILKLSAIGDVVMAMPVATALKRASPDAWITWAAHAPAAQMLRGHPAVDEVLLVGRPSGRGMGGAAFYMAEWFRLAPALRRGRFDVTLDLQGLLKAALLGVIAGAPRRLGFADERREFNRRINNVPVETTAAHRVDRFLAMAEALGADPYPVDFAFPRSPEAEQWADEFLTRGAADGAPLVGLIPFASDPHRCWPAERFARVAQSLAMAGLRGVVIGGPSEAAKAREIAGASGSSAMWTAGEAGLLGTAALLRRCRLVIGNDTGPLHIGAAVGTPTLGLYGPADPAEAGPYGSGNRVLWHAQPCGPCGRKPTCTDWACMSAIPVEEVLEQAAALLGTDLQA